MRRRSPNVATFTRAARASQPTADSSSLRSSVVGHDRCGSHRAFEDGLEQRRALRPATRDGSLRTTPRTDNRERAGDASRGLPLSTLHVATLPMTPRRNDSNEFTFSGRHRTLGLPVRAAASACTPLVLTWSFHRCSHGPWRYLYTNHPNGINMALEPQAPRRNGCEPCGQAPR